MLNWTKRDKRYGESDKTSVFFSLGMMGYFNYNGRHRRIQQLLKVTLLETFYLHILQIVTKSQWHCNETRRSRTLRYTSANRRQSIFSVWSRDCSSSRESRSAIFVDRSSRTAKSWLLSSEIYSRVATSFSGCHYVLVPSVFSTGYGP